MDIVKLILGAALVAMCALPITPVSPAAAQPCPDVEVVFARGTYEPPGVGGPASRSSTRCAPAPENGRSRCIR